MEPQTFLAACQTYRSSVEVLFTLIHWSRVNLRRESSIEQAKLQIQGAALSDQRKRPREPPSVHCVIMEKAMYFSISDTVHPRSCTISSLRRHYQGVPKDQQLVLKVPFRTKSRPRQSRLPAFVKKEI